MPTRRLLIADVARELGVSDDRVRQIIDDGGLRFELVGNDRPIMTFDRGEVDALAAGRECGAFDRLMNRTARQASRECAEHDRRAASRALRALEK